MTPIYYHYFHNYIITYLAICFNIISLLPLLSFAIRNSLQRVGITDMTQQYVKLEPGEDGVTFQGRRRLLEYMLVNEKIVERDQVSACSFLVGFFFIMVIIYRKFKICNQISLPSNII